MAHENGWEMHVAEGDIPKNGTVELRISDDVFDEEDWPIVECVLKNSKVVSSTIVRAGTYSTDFVKRLVTRKDISRWSKYYSTEQHPENYYMVRCKGLS